MLQVLSSLEPGDKLATRHHRIFVRQPKSLLQPVFRYATGETRGKNLTEIDSVLTKIDQSLKSNATAEEMQTQMLNALRAAEEGLETLTTTYARDQATSDRLHGFITRVQGLYQAERERSFQTATGAGI